MSHFPACAPFPLLSPFLSVPHMVRMGDGPKRATCPQLPSFGVTPMAVPRAFRFPSFSLAFAGSLATIALFVLWALSDNSFFAVTGGHWVYWDELTTRYVLFVVLAACGFASTAIAFFRLFVGNRAARSLKGYFAVVALIGIWLMFMLNHDRVAWTGFVWHFQRMVPGLKTDVKELCSAWPVKDGELPNLGKYKIQKITDAFPADLLPESWTPGFQFSHAVHSVERGPNGRIKFGLGKFPAWIEYRADPNEYTWSLSDEPFRFQEAHERELTLIEFEPKWFLVWTDNVGSLGPR